MKAKTVNENLGFQRNRKPKSALGLGGWTPEESYQEIRMEAWERWNKQIADTLEGKRIRFKGLMKNPDTTAHHTFLRVDKEITVGDTKNPREFWSEFELQDAETGQWYTITPYEKITFL